MKEIVKRLFFNTLLKATAVKINQMPKSIPIKMVNPKEPVLKNYSIPRFYEIPKIKAEARNPIDAVLVIPGTSDTPASPAHAQIINQCDILGVPVITTGGVGVKDDFTEGYDYYAVLTGNGEYGIEAKIDFFGNHSPQSHLKRLNEVQSTVFYL